MVEEFSVNAMRNVSQGNLKAGLRTGGLPGVPRGHRGGRRRAGAGIQFDVAAFHRLGQMKQWMWGRGSRVGEPKDAAAVGWGSSLASPETCNRFASPSRPSRTEEAPSDACAFSQDRYSSRLGDYPWKRFIRSCSATPGSASSSSYRPPSGRTPATTWPSMKKSRAVSSKTAGRKAREESGAARRAAPS